MPAVPHETEGRRREETVSTRVPFYNARGAAIAAGLLLALASVALAQDNRDWKPLVQDGVHDPKSPSLQQLQSPSAALSRLPTATGGDRVGWSEALEKKLIAPRSGIKPGGDAPMVMDLDIYLDLNGSQLPVRFSHRVHTEWLDCTNCHDALFKMQRGASGISMLKILEGEQCGVCHGAIAFPLTECRRCHSVPYSALPPSERGRK